MLNRRTTLHTASLAAAVAAALALVLTGCDAESDGGADAGKGKDGKPAVIAPGKPGEAAKKLSAEEAAKAGDDDSANTADRSYVRMMIEHHAQALLMTDLADDRAESAKVKRLAERIAAGQKPEIEAMRAWQKTDGGAPKGGDGAHEGHDARMPGMATAAELKRLRDAEGADFDALFLKLMIAHHRGAVSMATDVLAQGNNIRVEEMAGDVIAQQSSEIRRMLQMS
ncbi:DUF305 domain-containing protein [Streptomyces melanosporofaciens]|uniref:Uncharacterized conserved protein, DUF305 family n=1 Tax=Streptomyces melanosporofaciens TaxID=67327 RepID=A0A1H5AB16_STRMJ|nr:DUF305 domain-containing protein [Streptomyces melanosporofaciens]SED38961.1 Uncharacterized conserved protein, DUF305 family [Streptomyces melanosporofaciens]